MRKIREALRLQAQGLSKRRIALSLGISATAAGSYLARARKAGLAWPLPDGLDDEALELQLFPMASGDGAPGAARIRTGLTSTVN